MVSVMILEGIYSYEDVLCKEFHDIYVPLLVSVLRSNRIKCETVDFKGLARKYNIKGEADNNLLYVPRIEKCDENLRSITFINTDSTSLLSPSYSVACNIRKYRSMSNKSNVVFVEQLKENEPLKNFSPVILDKIRIGENIELNGYNSYIFELALSVTKAICEYYAINTDI